MDKVFLHGMKVQTLVGVYEWERQHRQTLVLDLDMGLETLSLQSDDIDDTVHYGMVCEAVRQELAQCDFLLLERLAEHTAQFVFAQFKQVVWLRLRVVKPGILPDVQEVGVEIERSRFQAA